MSDSLAPRALRTALAVVVGVLTAACEAADTADGDGAEAMAPAAVVSGPTVPLADVRRTITVAQEKFNGLAESMPEESYAWRPMDGVRSVGEVFVHMAADNYFVPAMMGVAAPAETGITADGATFRAYQERQMTKEETTAALAASFDFLLASLDATGDELAREMQLGPNTVTVGDLWVRAVVHLHEHLGQSIAYARSNDVVPPWSR